LGGVLNFFARISGGEGMWWHVLPPVGKRRGIWEFGVKRTAHGVKRLESMGGD
jgi:hypothetical protein